jgi:hypothetical protein
VFSQDDIICLRNTLNNIKQGIIFSRFMSGDIIYSNPSYKYLPYYGWPKLNDQALRTSFENGWPPVTSFWDLLS